MYRDSHLLGAPADQAGDGGRADRGRPAAVAAVLGLPDDGRCEALVAGERCPRPATHRRWDWRLCRAHAHREENGVLGARLVL